MMPECKHHMPLDSRCGKCELKEQIAKVRADAAELGRLADEFNGKFGDQVHASLHRKPAGVQNMREALEFARVAIEPFDDEKPRCWKTDHERLRQAHSVVKEALAQPAAVELTGLESFSEWLESIMPSGTVIGNPGWWAPRIYRAVIAAHEAKKNGGGV